MPSCARAEAPARARATLSSSARGLFIKHALFQPGSHAASKPSYPLGIPRIPSRRRPHSLASEGHVRGGAPTNKRKGLSSGRRCRSALRQAARAGRQGAGSERGTCAKSPPGRSPHQNSQHSASALSHPQTKKKRSCAHNSKTCVAQRDRMPRGKRPLASEDSTTQEESGKPRLASREHKRAATPAGPPNVGPGRRKEPPLRILTLAVGEGRQTLSGVSAGTKRKASKRK